MFRQEAIWIQETLSSIQPLAHNNKVANLGSSSVYFRQTVQPHIHQHIIAPLVQKQWSVINIDIKKEDGIDLIADITKASYSIENADQFALTLCTNMLEHVENIGIAVQNIYSSTVVNGFILLTVPYKYKKHLDPIDNMFRPTPTEIYNLFRKGSVEIIASAIIAISDKQYYPVKQSRFPFWGYRNRIAFWLGKRHKVSGILLQVKKDVRHNRHL